MKPTSGLKAHTAPNASGHSAANTSNHSASIVITTRKERNRLSAKASRLRRQQHLNDVEARLQLANDTIVNLQTQIQVLRHQLNASAFVSWVDEYEFSAQPT